MGTRPLGPKEIDGLLVPPGKAYTQLTGRRITGHNSKQGHNSDMKKIWVNYFFMRYLYMKSQNPNIHLLKVSNFTEKWKNQSKFQNSVFLSKFDGKFSKLNQVTHSSAPISIPNMKALAQILF